MGQGYGMGMGSGLGYYSPFKAEPLRLAYIHAFVVKIIFFSKT